LELYTTTQHILVINIKLKITATCFGSLDHHQNTKHSTGTYSECAH